MTISRLSVCVVRLVLGFVLGVGICVGASAEPVLLGEISFPNSGAAGAQGDFLEGVLFMHNFEYRDASAAFKRAQEIDPDFAMAYWGEAMAYNHPLWNEHGKDAAEKALRRLGRTPEARREKAGTQREKDYLWAVETLYGQTEASKREPKNARDDLYSEEMRRIHETYPEDQEATTFYGLSILGTSHDGRDFAIYMKAAAVLTEVWDVNRMHPGAAHYLIHSYDDPVHAPLGLPMAWAYSKIAPTAAHAQHMVSHIFVALGMWDELVTSNEIAVEVQGRRTDEPQERRGAAGHYTAWLEYGYLQQGRFKAAAKVVDGAFDRMENDPTTSEKTYFASMRARYVFDTEDWRAVERWASPVEIESAAYHFTDLVSALERGELDAARASDEAMRAVKSTRRSSGTDPVYSKMSEGLFALEAEDGDGAVTLLEEAVAMELALPYVFGPPNIVKPPSELLGDTLRSLGRHEEAITAYRAQLKRTPLRTNTLRGLAQSAEAAGNITLASDSYRTLAGIWHDADRKVPGRAEAFKTTRAR